MSAIEVIRREKKKNKKLQAELDKKKDTQELEQMITKLKVQIEEDKRIEETLKEQLEGKDGIIGNLEVEIVTLRKDIQKKNMQNSSKVLDDIIKIKNLILTSPDLDTIKQKRDQAPKQQRKKQIQKVMQKQSKGIKRYTRKITGTLLHREDSDFRINNR
jgi:DNA repair exonuclease SbcCD ATPase subunit